jgi:hypothetical protein
MAAIASSMSAAMELLSLGDSYEFVEHNIGKGIDFCRLVEQGLAAETTNVFSARSLEAQDLVAVLSRLPNGRTRFVESATRVRTELEALRPPAVIDSGVTGRLRAHFYDLEALLSLES